MNNLAKNLSVLILSILLSVGILLGVTNQAQATNNNQNQCHESRTHKCFKPTATPTQIPTPTIAPCNWEWLNWVFDKKVACDEPSVTPTPDPTDEPSVTPSEEPSVSPSVAPTSDNGSPATPGPAVCSIQITSPKLQGANRVDSTSVEFSWWAPQEGADYYAISYGYAWNKLDYGQSKIDGGQTSIVLHDLQPNTQVFAKVIAYKGACSSESNVYQTTVMPLAAPATGRAE